jgi:FAD/FMN-containing dehydrogenase
MIDRRPAIVARAATVSDVVAALRFGRSADLPIAVRSGGHSAPGHSTCDDGIVIDLSQISGVDVDVERRVATVAGGSLLGELDDAAQALGLACPVGVVSHTGVAGLTLGGGVGRLQRKLGLTIDNLRAVELVTADCELIRASAEENADLFWGVRGAGANFGIVTSFEFDLHPLGPEVTTASFVHPATSARDLAAFFADYMASAPDEVTGSFALARALPVEGYPQSVAGEPIARIGFTHCGPAETAARDLAPAASFGAPVAGTISPVSYLVLQRSLDEVSAWGHRSYSKAIYADRLPDEIVPALVEHVANAPDDGTIAFGALGGAIARVPEEATAYAGRGAAFMVGIDCLWDDSALDDAHLGWARAAAEALEPYRTTGVYVNAISDSGADVARAAYGDAKLERLVALKRAWDPDNVFRLNQNIRP